jgi:hypothetical protein
MDDLDIVAVRIEHPCCIIAGIVFEPSLRCFLALASGGHSGFVERVYDNTGRSNRDDEKTVLKELVPMLACLNSSNAGLSGFWSSAVRYNRSL